MDETSSGRDQGVDAVLAGDDVIPSDMLEDAQFDALLDDIHNESEQGGAGDSQNIDHPKISQNVRCDKDHELYLVV